jgi:hypothetical protein
MTTKKVRPDIAKRSRWSVVRKLERWANCFETAGIFTAATNAELARDLRAAVKALREKRRAG